MSNDTRPQYVGKELEAMSFAINYHKWIVQSFRPYLGETVAEVGAGIGSVSRLLLETGIKHLYAFEPSENLYPYLEEELHHEKHATAINDFFGIGYARTAFDSVVYINVLEHIEDDVTELVTAQKALKPNGHLLLFVPALPGLYSDIDKRIGHFRRYKKKELSDLVRAAGFTIQEAKYFDFAGMISWHINFVLFKRSLDIGKVALYDNYVVPTIRLVERIVTPPLGKNILLIGKRA